MLSPIDPDMTVLNIHCVNGMKCIQDDLFHIPPCLLSEFVKYPPNAVGHRRIIWSVNPCNQCDSLGKCCISHLLSQGS